MSYAYCEETKKFTMTLGCAFYDENLEYVCGVLPQRATLNKFENVDGFYVWPVYDIVDRVWVPRSLAGALTPGRAEAHFAAA